MCHVRLALTVLYVPYSTADLDAGVDKPVAADARGLARVEHAARGRGP